MLGMKMLLESFGIKIEPKEIETAWDRAKDALPRLAAAFDEINATQKRIEAKLDLLLVGTTFIQAESALSQSTLKKSGIAA